MRNEKPQDRTFWNRIGNPLHWHVVLTHFPVSFFLVSAGFMILHIVTANGCFEISAFLTLIAGTVMLLPTAATGWFTWKLKYKGAKTKIFRYKLRISSAMTALCVLLIMTRGFLKDASQAGWHIIFTIGVSLLFIGAMAEGFYGGQLNH